MPVFLKLAAMQIAAGAEDLREIERDTCNPERSTSGGWLSIYCS